MAMLSLTSRGAVSGREGAVAGQTLPAGKPSLAVGMVSVAGALIINYTDPMVIWISATKVGGARPPIRGSCF